jgi:hypothetical protein
MGSFGDSAATAPTPVRREGNSSVLQIVRMLVQLLRNRREATVHITRHKYRRGSWK